MVSRTTMPMASGMARPNAAVPGNGQDDQDFLSGVGRRGERVGGEDRQADQLADGLVGRIGGRQRPADQPTGPGAVRLAFDLAADDRRAIIEFDYCHISSRVQTDDGRAVAGTPVSFDTALIPDLKPRL